MTATKSLVNTETFLPFKMHFLLLSIPLLLIRTHFFYTITLIFYSKWNSFLSDNSTKKNTAFLAIFQRSRHRSAPVGTGRHRYRHLVPVPAPVPLPAPVPAPAPAPAPLPAPAPTGPDRHVPAPNGTDRHRPARTGTDRHRPAQDRHEPAPCRHDIHFDYLVANNVNYRCLKNFFRFINLNIKI